MLNIYIYATICRVIQILLYYVQDIIWGFLYNILCQPHRLFYIIIYSAYIFLLVVTRLFLIILQYPAVSCIYDELQSSDK